MNLVHSEDTPYLVVGLGNPGRGHVNNRHNIGFKVIDQLAAALGCRLSRRRSRAHLAEGAVEGKRVVLAKPQTYMNLVGHSVAPLVRYYRVPLSHLLLVCDDLDLPLGTLRLRERGGSAGHKGLRSVFEHLHSQAFPRLRLGIGRPPDGLDPADYVLQNFASGERDQVLQVVSRSVDCIMTFVAKDLQTAMNVYNGSAS